MKWNFTEVHYKMWVVHSIIQIITEYSAIYLIETRNSTDDLDKLKL